MLAGMFTARHTHRPNPYGFSLSRWTRRPRIPEQRIAAVQRVPAIIAARALMVPERWLNTRQCRLDDTVEWRHEVRLERRRSDARPRKPRR